jgi:hypothetical protein
VSASPNAVMDQAQAATTGALAQAQQTPGQDPAQILQQKEAALAPQQQAITAATNDLKATPQPGPAQTPPTPNQPLVDPNQYSKFSAALVAMAFVAGSKSKGNWLGVSSSLNGALKGYLEGNEQKASESWKRYQADYDKAIEKHKEQEQDYAQTINNKKLSINQMLTELQWKAAKYDDQYALTLARQKRIDDLYKTVFGMARQREQLDLQAKSIDSAVEKRAAEIAALKGGGDDMQANAKAIAEYREAPPTLSSRNPRGYALMAEVMKLNPEYDANEYKTRGRGETAFGTGKQGDTVRSLNVAVQHLDLLEGLGKDLNNSDNKSTNRFFNAIGKEFGRENVTNFETAKTIVGDEVVKAVIGAGAGSLADREDLQAKFDASSSPTQLLGVIKTAKGLMAGQLKGLERQYQSTTGKKDFESKLDPETQSALSGGAAGAPKPYADPAKEARYQAWKAAHPDGQ